VPSPVSSSPNWLSVVGSWTGLWGPVSPPMFQVNGSLLDDASLPSIGSRRARFPDFIGTMKALRLPAPARLVPYDFGSRSHARLLCSSSPKRSRRTRRRLVRPGTLVQPAFPPRHVTLVDVCGISQVSWRSILCLCPAPRPRPSRQDLALAILPMLPPANPDRRPQRVHNLEANTGL
jgi:hypothetical protein